MLIFRSIYFIAGNCIRWG